MSLTLSRARVSELLERAQGKRIAVIGDAMLDVYLSGDVERISPEAPVPVVRVRARKQALGGAANVAQNVAAVGASCELVAAVGEDRGGATLRELLVALGTGTESLVTVSRGTTQKTRVVARSQQLVRIDEEDELDLVGDEMERLIDAVRMAVESADGVVLEDYNKGVLVAPVIRAAIDGARKRSIPIVVDPKYRNFFAYTGVTVFKPNRRELEAALGASVDIGHPETLAATLARIGANYLLVTLGESGMALVSQDGAVVQISTAAREVFDVVGAGDTVTAYLACTLAAGGTALESAIIANFAAGIEVGKLGAATVTPAELLAFADEHGHLS